MKYCCDELEEASHDDRFDFNDWPPSITADSDSGFWSIEMNHCIFCGAKL